MSKLLAQLMAMPESDLAARVFDLEKLSGHGGTDVKLALEIEKLAEAKVKNLGLDPNDTDGPELYHALLSRFEQDENKFVRSLGATSRHGHDDLLPLIVDQLTKVKAGSDCWALKRSVAKELLKSCPPKAVMKHLNYRTIDSLLKRESVEEILMAAPFAESDAWRKKFIKHFATFTPADFESRAIEIVAMPKQRWENLPSRGAVVGYMAYLGSVAVWPAKLERSRGLALAVLILKAMDNIRVASSWLEFNQVNPAFKDLLIAVAEGESPVALMLGDNPIYWQSILYHYSQNQAKKLHPILDDRLPSEHAKLLPAEVILSKFHPHLTWWLQLDYIGELKDRVISFNIADVAINYANGLPYQNATTYWMKQAVNDELTSRYFTSSWVEDSLMSKIDESELG